MMSLLEHLTMKMFSKKYFYIYNKFIYNKFKDYG